ncbi:TAXI family TRAP transporter solute-binding subunit [Stella sp.]|uniref:TAXI family TRAP transporter solute-binding subunit n=1 Tax=Stella sp. TaxID=2912054 RepID=UPI0035B045C2
MRVLAAAVLAGGLLLSHGAAAETRLTLKAAASGSAYYVMTVQLAETIRTETKGSVQPTVEESQGSVQNVKEAARRPGAYLFTSPPGLVAAARGGRKPFEGESGYDGIRGLFTLPAITMHWVVRADAGVSGFADLAGKRFVAGGRGTFTQRQSDAVFKLLGIADKVTLVDVELNAAVNAMRNRQIDGFATGGSFPAPNLQELAVSTPIRLLGLEAAQIESIRKDDPSATPLTIPAGIYKGVDTPTRTIALPVGAYGTLKMDEDTAYAIVKAFWARKAEMAKQNPWWDGVTPDQIALLGTALHPGAVRYYREAGIPVPAAQ